MKGTAREDGCDAGLNFEVAALRHELAQARRLLDLKDEFIAELEVAAREAENNRDDADRYRRLRERLERHPVARRALRLFRVVIR